MHETPLHHKPVFYGAAWLELAFVALIVAHALAGAAGTGSGVVAVLAAKGKRLHRRAGTVFLWSMGAAAITGVLANAIRLGVAYEANHRAVAGMGLPSTIPARLGFLYSGLCVLYLLRQGLHRRTFLRGRGVASSFALDGLPPLLLLPLGAALTALIALRLNPWTGALWMIWTFMGAVAWSAWLRRRASRGEGAQLAEHRVNMLFLAGFSWWAALQGFGPALGWLLAPPASTAPLRPYLGDQPGPFEPGFFGYLLLWAPPLLLAAGLGLFFARRRARAA